MLCARPPELGPRRALLLAGCLIALAGCTSPPADEAAPAVTSATPTPTPTAATPAAPTPTTQPPTGTTPAPAPERSSAGTPQVLASGLRAPWGLAFLPDGSGLVSERDTRRIVRVSADGAVQEVDVVDEAEARGEGGLLGIAISANYALERLRHVALEPSGAALWVLTSNRDGRGRPASDDDRVVRIPLEQP